MATVSKVYWCLTKITDLLLTCNCHFRPFYIQFYILHYTLLFYLYTIGCFVVVFELVDDKKSTYLSLFKVTGNDAIHAPCKGNHNVT